MTETEALVVVVGRETVVEVGQGHGVAVHLEGGSDLALGRSETESGVEENEVSYEGSVS